MIDLNNKNFFIKKEVKTNLEKIIKSKIFSNGYIFYGPDGTGKKQTALKFIGDIFKNYASSSNVEERIKVNNHPDFLLIEPTYLVKGKLINRSDSELPKNNEIIRIDQIRK